MDEFEEKYNDTPQLRRRFLGSVSEEIDRASNESLSNDLVSEEEIPKTDKKERKKLTIKLETCKKPEEIVDDKDEAKEIDEEDEILNEENNNKEQSKVRNLKKCKFTIWQFFIDEISRGYCLQNDSKRFTEKRRKVYAFLKIPWELEKFFLFGIFQCIDAFIYVFTFLPIKILFNFLSILLNFKNWSSSDSINVIKLLTIVICSTLMQFIDTSVIYHQVRGQAIIKLYIFYNMLEVVDKLCSSFGQDTFDALYLTVSEQDKVKKIPHIIVLFIFSLVFSSMHTFIILLQATTLNVAFNSHNQALLTIMISNNFVELKGSVFKKFGKPNLFQMACSDVRERFHTFILLVVVVLRNMTAVNWQIDHFVEMWLDLVLVIFAEIAIDWFKHAFITKFNEINADIYKDFTLTLAFDVVRCKEENAFTDFSDQVARRMGFIPIHLLILLLRIISQSVSFSQFTVVLLCGTWILLFLIKILNGYLLYNLSCHFVSQYREMQLKLEEDDARNRVVSSKSKSAPSSPKISLIDFSDILTQAQNKNTVY
ncbi:Transmembrane anterior posterior transformation protein 1 homolog [Strongyloides ratti]|uniref:Transmembrane anterior posterior transformation protein 1 homolog n=1 Tax=Strongyloides ratti TaxID=34506 RepID=A0A090L5T1_STRRB|nr:Transmembrane anterior posterior transformation protein 1 homolog [Strongyloides ratti]CEF63477.1 Transmembrane anterior posterior transformation protein 1 homolog [Strongyloides ratti]